MGGCGRPGSGTPGSSKSERTKARLLDAAEEVFGAHGYHAGSIVEITRRAHVAQGTFYLYWPSKLEIFRHLVRVRITGLRERIREGNAELTDPREIFASTFRTLFAWIRRHPGISRIWREAEFVDPALAEDIYRVPAEALTVRFRSLMEAGAMPPSHPEVLSWALIGMGELVALRWIIWEGGKALPDDALDAYIEAALRMLGLTPPHAPPG